MKDTYYFKHDYNARNDPKLIKVARKFGMAGIGTFWCLTEMMFEQGGQLPMEVQDLAFDLRTKPELLLSLVKDFGLFKHDDNVFWSESVRRRLSDRKEIQEKKKAAAKARWDAKTNADAMHVHSISNARKGKERKGKERKGKNINSSMLLSQFEVFWDAYQKKTGREHCIKRWLSLTDADRLKILEVAPIYVSSKPDKKFRKDPLTWLNGKHWEDEIISEDPITDTNKKTTFQTSLL